jgi:hypothetical protein
MSSALNIFRDVRRWLAGGDFPSVKTTTVYVDHIAENTGAHGIVMNHTVLPNADDTQSLGSDAFKWLGVFGKSFDSRRTDYGGFTVRCFNNAGGVYGAFRMIHARGSAGSPTALVTDSSLGFLEWMGYDGTDEEYGAYIAVSATENWTHTPEAHGSQLRFYTTAIGADAPTLQVRIDSTGLLLANTCDLISHTAGGSDIGTAANYFGNSYITNMYADHIAERTAAHTIVVDSNMTMTAAKDIIAGSTDCDIGTTAALFGNICGTNFYNPKMRITPEGGYAIKLTNKTGGNSVQGQIVIASTTVDNAFETAAANDQMPIGVIYNAGIADGQECWIVVAGIADVLIDAGGCTNGSWLGTGATAGSADSDTVPGLLLQHFREIGHALEDRADAGLAKAVLHFN